MKKLAYHVVLVCPDDWKAEQATLLAERLLADSLPEAVGVTVYVQDSETLREVTES